MIDKVPMRCLMCGEQREVTNDLPYESDGATFPDGVYAGLCPTHRVAEFARPDDVTAAVRLACVRWVADGEQVDAIAMSDLSDVGDEW